MRALICPQFGPPDVLEVQSLPTPKPGPDEVLLRVQAAGVNYPDALIVAGQYQVRPPLPFTPGAEAAGVIEAVGTNVQHLQVGQAVAAYTGTGAFATHLLVPASQALPLPPQLAPAVAAVLPLAYGTSMHALVQRAALQKGETLLVLGGAGGVGLAAVMIGRALGARVIAGVSSEAKAQAARDAGAQYTINYAAENLREKLRELTGGRGPDVIFDPVGGDLTEAAFRSMAWQGRHLIIGFADGSIPKLPLNLPLLKGAALVGVFWGEFARRQPSENAQNMQQLAQWVSAGQLTPLISAQYPLEQTPAALTALLRREVLGKVVVVP